ncbi:MAG: T9SS type A sorting domain-containing protein [Cytophagales bacterium]|nr:T9SS type A sorting domain-containing protein [Cytophagales bacterium]
MLTMPADQARTVTVAGGQTLCIRGAGNFLGRITLDGSAAALCVDSEVNVAGSSTLNFTGNNATIINYGTWEKSFTSAGNRIRLVENRGTMTLNGFTVSEGATFRNYGNLEIIGDLVVSGGNNRFDNLGEGVVNVTGEIRVSGNGNNNGFFHSGTSVTATGFTNVDNNANTEISAPLNVTNLSINGGTFSVVKAIVTVTGNYTQQGNNPRVSGGTPQANCGAIVVGGVSTINSGTFGSSGFMGLCDSNGNAAGGFDVVNSGGVIGPNGNLRCACFQALPITLIYFTAKQQESQVLLQWATASEKDNEYFSLEKSRDGQQFNEIGRVAGAGTSTGKLTYQFTDDFPFGGTGYYRLKQVDFDGTFTYSRIVAVNREITAALRIYPNPLAGNELWVEANDVQADDMRITIHNTVGKLLVDRVYAYEPAVKVDLTALRREPGLYILSVRRKNRIERQKLVIQ